ncbi:hypothetical protein C2G38_2195462 [Gigaspora rosea]|uniref:Uncharacterized protein n=1 Tax=Gigaspora rosea TaxID=44941 RepID=A0A397UW45_9GLOM|nr:hypothetical protein C2G38_2195462 [Gigaspora rosea]
MEVEQESFIEKMEKLRNGRWNRQVRSYTETQDEMIDQMETESITTVKSDEVKQRSYSEVVQASTKEEAPKRRVYKVSEKEVRWINEIMEALASKVTAEFDEKKWHIERIVQAFGSLEELEVLLRHKIETKPMTNSQPKAICLKFKHRNMAFFKPFA